MKTKNSSWLEQTTADSGQNGPLAQAWKKRPALKHSAYPQRLTAGHARTVEEPSTVEALSPLVLSSRLSKKDRLLWILRLNLPLM